MVSVMNKQFETRIERESISALMDGQLRAEEMPAVMQGMNSSEACDCWRLYHLVGDVLRSPDLAACAHDADFIIGLRERLAGEAPPSPAMVPTPVVVGAAARVAANDGVFRWKMVAGLASFAAVAALGWGVLGGLGPQPGGAQLAQNQGEPAGSTRVVALTPPLAASSASLPMADAEAVMVRDPRLDELLAAHRQAVGASALGNSAGFMRNVTFDGAGR